MNKDILMKAAREYPAEEASLFLLPFQPLGANAALGVIDEMGVSRSSHIGYAFWILQGHLVAGTVYDREKLPGLAVYLDEYERLSLRERLECLGYFLRMEDYNYIVAAYEATRDVDLQEDEIEGEDQKKDESESTTS